jgi:subtilase family serine protease
VSALKGKSVTGAGATYTAKDTTKNAGEAAAPASETRFYLSVDAIKDDGDTPLPPVQGRSVGVLAPGATSSGATKVTIPPGTPSSKWFLIACADGGGAIAESNEGNNCRSKTLYVGPDLVVSKLTAPASAPAGSSILVTDTTDNAGGAATTSVTTTRLYLSVDKKLGGSDIPLGPGRSVPVLAAGGSDTAGTMVTIPPGTVPRVYYIIAKADDGGVETESKETNNIKAKAITVN